jgi:hypothetical protein
MYFVKATRKWGVQSFGQWRLDINDIMKKVLDGDAIPFYSVQNLVLLYM